MGLNPNLTELSVWKDVVNDNGGIANEKKSPEIYGDGDVTDVETLN